ncbi:alpha/beta hydrolase [Demequina sp.]|uniref:alpha/beta fold hydrolase n=1 Tax=Demequina sp. TaxID=2050685 RepID=UPI0025F58CE5|nr:alpha/beta hydrolase [Demequina sp.]
MPRIVLLHGAATTPAVWSRVAALLGGREVVAPERPSTGSLASELGWLAPLAEGALVVGASGGATLCLALAASDVRLAGAIAHEPAVGRLVPELLAPIAAAHATHGAAGMGRALYGPLWEPSMAPDAGAVARDLQMFRAFEPARAATGQGRVLVTTGARSPKVRFIAAARLATDLGYRTTTIPDCGHFVAFENPESLAALIADTADALDGLRDD